MNLASLDLRSWRRPAIGGGPSVFSGAKVFAPVESSLARGEAPPTKAEDAVAVTPGCRLWLEGWDGQDGACDILELSPHGVTIALAHRPRSPWGDRGELLIGPPGGDHYVLPVAVRRVKHSPDASILELVFPKNERWSYHRGRREVTAATNR